MKLRLLPVILSVVISSTLLFGGYFAYQSYAMENPLQKIVNGIEGVELVSTHLTADKAAIDVKLAAGKSLREVYSTIQTEGKPVIGDRELQIKVQNGSSPRLDAWWSSVLFEVAQAMETKQYAQIPKTLQAHTEADPNGIRATTEMDDRYVYITLTDGESSKYIMLPRTPAKMGVWPSE
ncbi:hypothetical protein P9314_02360 [Paenibacillus validus]|uniref:hypothetical protein n=1 Tax=Paenibacillus TaxID=44249 RepID=UPI000FD97752|nr:MULTISPECIES: hypothetical protein [Paenibacillus]MED4599547.1 hypothetical protein [Paenibacillus validus]MED4605533.1 hypothetical protein [Paenibacillus validus]